MIVWMWQSPVTPPVSMWVPSDLPVAVARKLLGPDKIVGATAKTVEAAKKAYEDGADYLGVGAIFPTTTKVVTIRTRGNTE